jgi:hypothetical protein
MELAIRMVAGAVAGAAVGFLIGRARVCSAQECNVRANLVFSIVAGAVFGAAVMYWALRG